ncbi:hypothetical protein NNJEOMEG_01188 [Fundidesulfovibrio magnetotacticus]|uniref:ABC transporter substrate binding protein n=1 Tax=Fundidesulfovibrio magnetotacticus TaxID=2730080 RepID=A0A6V8LU77_9BACT|nr:ABC transporter substrate-binding protein [Fundidesulfovibrio magnetotacticus]GFK93356.1 hypothetical protein NNJEOMEG_01188 [Fundidesulfovibrio magnetotacticus]
MKRMFTAVFLAFVLAAAVVSLQAPDRHGPRQHTVGILQHTANNASTVAGFKAELAKLDRKEGMNLTFVEPPPAATAADLKERMAEILAQKPDLVFASPTLAALTAREATRESGPPVVFAPVNDPVSSKVVETLHRPESNLTGVRLAPSEGRRLQELLELAPGARRVFVPYNPDDPSARASMEQLVDSARVLGVEIMALSISDTTDLFANGGLVPARAQAVFMPREGLVMSRFREFIALAEARRIPLSTPRMEQVREGVLTGYGFVGEELGRQAAAMANQILNGTPVSGMPVETAQDYLFINLAAARRIGLHVPDGFLDRAQYVFREPQ